MSVFVKISPLAWESQFFGLNSARLDFAGDLPLAVAVQHPCALLQIKIPAEQHEIIDAVNQHGFQLVEGEADLVLNIKRTERQTGVRIAREAQIPALREAAAQAFRQSRFRAPGMLMKRVVVSTRSGSKMRCAAPLIINALLPVMRRARSRALFR